MGTFFLPLFSLFFFCLSDFFPGSEGITVRKPSPSGKYLDHLSEFLGNVIARKVFLLKAGLYEVIIVDNDVLDAGFGEALRKRRVPHRSEERRVGKECR